MTRTSTFYSTAFVSAMAAYLVACGGGGGDAPTQPVELVDPAPVRADDGTCLLGGPREWAAGEACRVFTWGTGATAGDEA